jgi:hypothetical protein
MNDNQDSGTVSVRALQAAVALVTAQAAGLGLPQGDVLGDCPADEALTALTAPVAGLMRAAAPGFGTAVLRSVGAAVAQSAGEDAGGE